MYNIINDIGIVLKTLHARITALEPDFKSLKKQVSDKEAQIEDQAKQLVKQGEQLASLTDTVKSLTDKLSAQLDPSLLAPIKSELDQIAEEMRPDDTTVVDTGKVDGTSVEPIAQPGTDPAPVSDAAVAVSDLPAGTQTDVVAAAPLESTADEGVQQAGQTVEAAALFDKSGRRV